MNQNDSIPYRPLPPIQTVFKVKSTPPSFPATKTLTEKQIENWRNHLFYVVGPVAFLMRREEIQKIRDGVQAKFPLLAEGISNK